MTTHVLVVDDEALLRRSLAFNLEQAGYRTSSAANAEDALALARRDPPDLVLLDIGLPGMDGLEAMRYFRSDIGSPVILVTARRRELDQVVGLELGADDYVTKPFDTNVLLARIKAVLRRSARGAASSNDPDASVVTVGDLVVDPNAYVAMLRGKPLDLSPREFDLLHALALDAGRVLSVDDLLARVWGAEYVGESQVVYVHIRWLRQKLEDDASRPTRIVTVRGKGYKLIAQTEAAPASADQSNDKTALAA
jgi:DNA-binding response OmpR family regulator